jgi:anti-sigma-K factor RskA
MNNEHPDQYLLDEYALQTLPDAEALRIRSHVQGCDACRKQLEERKDALGNLALLIPGAEPPTGLEESIMRKIADTPQNPRHHAGSRTEAARVWGPVPAAIAAVLIVALGVGNIVQWHRAGAPREAAPGLALIVLAGQAGAPDAYGTVVLDPKDNGGVLAVRGLPRLDAGRVYQLWLMKGGERRSCGVFGVSGDGYGNLLLEVPKDFREFTGIGITIEPPGGSTLPSGPFVAASTR